LRISLAFVEHALNDEAICDPILLNDSVPKHLLVFGEKDPNFQVRMFELTSYEVDTVELNGFPLEDLLTGARVIRTAVHCENQAIILMLQLLCVWVEQAGKQSECLPNWKHFLHVHVDWRKSLCTLLLGTRVERSGWQEALLYVLICFLQSPLEVQVHNILGIDNQRIKDQVDLARVFAPPV